MNAENTDTRLIIFAKAPKPGFAKTRLIPQLGEQGAAELAQQLLDHTIAIARTTSFQHIELCVTPCPPDPFFETTARTKNVVLSCQIEGDLGMRMSAAFTQHLQHTSKVILIGTDAPGLTPAMLHEASELLTTHDAVFIPALDGGYTLIGLAKHHPALFSNIPWSTDRVMAATRAALEQANFSWAELEALPDIDEPQDLIHLPRHWAQ
jgi:rSAM/selenodomain-associated transferase 1